MHEEQRGLRFPFNAAAEIFVANSPQGVPARVTELSLRGCRIETSGSLIEQQNVRVKVFSSGESFEAPATVIYVKPSGVGLVFGEMKPDSRAVLQKWVLAELDKKAG